MARLSSGGTAFWLGLSERAEFCHITNTTVGYPAKMDTAAVGKMKVTELKADLEARGLDTTGLKAVLAARLTEAIEAGWQRGGR